MAGWCSWGTFDRAAREHRPQEPTPQQANPQVLPGLGGPNEDAGAGLHGPELHRGIHRLVRPAAHRTRRYGARSGAGAKMDPKNRDAKQIQSNTYKAENMMILIIKKNLKIDERLTKSLVSGEISIKIRKFSQSKKNPSSLNQNVVSV